MNNCECPLAGDCDVKPGYFDCARKLMELNAENYRQKEKKMQGNKVDKLIKDLEAAIEGLKSDILLHDLCDKCENSFCNGIVPNIKSGNHNIVPEFIVLKCNGYEPK